MNKIALIAAVLLVLALVAQARTVLYPFKPTPTFPVDHREIFDEDEIYLYDRSLIFDEDEYELQSGSSVASFAQSKVGTKYVYGGTSFATGIDCSGFVYVLQVFNHLCDFAPFFSSLFGAIFEVSLSCLASHSHSVNNNNNNTQFQPFCFSIIPIAKHVMLTSVFPSLVPPVINVPVVVQSLVVNPTGKLVISYVSLVMLLFTWVMVVLSMQQTPTVVLSMTQSMQPPPLSVVSSKFNFLTLTTQ